MCLCGSQCVHTHWPKPPVSVENGDKGHLCSISDFIDNGTNFHH